MPISYKVEHILLTHGHPDHVAGLAETARVLPDAKIYLHAEDVPTMNAAPDVGAVRLAKEEKIR